MIQRVYRLRATWPDGRVAWYQRKGFPPHWGDLESASLWPTERGPSSCIGSLNSYYRRYGYSAHMKNKIPAKMEIVPFGLVEIEE